MMKKIALFLSFLLILTSCGCPKKACEHPKKPMSEKDLLNFPRLSTVPAFPTQYPSHEEWEKIRKDLETKKQSEEEQPA